MADAKSGTWFARRVNLSQSAPLILTANHRLYPAHPVPLEGRIAIVMDVGRDAVDERCAPDESVTLRTAKSCGPDAPTLASSSRIQSAGDGGKKARSPGRARKKPLKPLRREGRMSRRTCGD